MDVTSEVTQKRHPFTLINTAVPIRLSVFSTARFDVGFVVYKPFASGAALASNRGNKILTRKRICVEKKTTTPKWIENQTNDQLKNHIRIHSLGVKPKKKKRNMNI